MLNLTTIKKIFLSILSALLGGIFIFSAYAKLYPIEPFEYTFVDLGLSNWQLAPFMARLLIGLEFLIGVLLILNILLKKFTYKLGIATLIIFCIYLILQLIISGNKGNCGCFGTTIYMSPLNALLKNIAMLAVFIALYIYHSGFSFGRFSKYIVIAVSIIACALPFILNPVQLDYAEAYLNKPETNFALPLDTLYKNATLSQPPKTLSKGKHVVLFFSLTCSHCRIAAKKVRTINKLNPAIPFYMVLNGKEEKLTPFFDDTHTEGIDHCMLKGQPFTYLAGVSLPVIYLVNNGVVEHQLDYITLDQKELENWLAKP
ncbi:MAG TPA: MauE/DoxX family redox-associated membrane protein [Bacteroidia bacterium]|nr:MauE/DoxX family redox-associated membrane protein [Bacteroidia bacterium]